MMSNKFDLSCNERAFQTKESIDLIKKHLMCNGFVCQTIEHGDKYKTVFCTIEDKSGQIVRGIGKGFGLQSMASALAEAIEHYYYEFDSSGIEMRILGESPFPDWYHRGSPNFKEILQGASVSLGHHVFHNILNGKEFEYPAFLSNPDYAPRTKEEQDHMEKFALVRYSCNSGTASGLTKTDADLHALLELIERDAIGLFLLDTVINKSPLPVKVLKKDTLPNRIFCYINELEEDLKSKIEVYDITSDLGIPAFLASMRLNDGARYFGSGASLFSDYALERSIVEAAQCVHAQEILGFKKPIEPKEDLIDGLPKYTRCLMDKGIFSPYAGYTKIRYKGDAERYSEKAPNTDTQLRAIVDSLQSHGIDVFRRNIISDESDSPMHVTQIVAPRLERFFLVTGGLHILPGHRGQERLNLLSTPTENQKITSSSTGQNTRCARIMPVS